MYTISERFRRTVNDAITRLERDAAKDARVMPNLVSEDHRNRQQRLVDAQIAVAVALRVRLTLCGDRLLEDLAPTDFALSEGA